MMTETEAVPAAAEAGLCCAQVSQTAGQPLLRSWSRPVRGSWRPMVRMLMLTARVCQTKRTHTLT